MVAKSAMLWARLSMVMFTWKMFGPIFAMPSSVAVGVSIGMFWKLLPSQAATVAAGALMMGPITAIMLSWFTACWVRIRAWAASARVSAMRTFTFLIKLACSCAKSTPWIAAAPNSAKSPESGASTSTVGKPAPRPSRDSIPFSAVLERFSATLPFSTFLYQ